MLVFYFDRAHIYELLHIDKKFVPSTKDPHGIIPLISSAQQVRTHHPQKVFLHVHSHQEPGIKVLHN